MGRTYNSSMGIPEPVLFASHDLPAEGREKYRQSTKYKSKGIPDPVSSASRELSAEERRGKCSSPASWNRDPPQGQALHQQAAPAQPESQSKTDDTTMSKGIPSWTVPSCTAPPQGQVKPSMDIPDPISFVTHDLPAEEREKYRSRTTWNRAPSQGQVLPQPQQATAMSETGPEKQEVTCFLFDL